MQNFHVNCKKHQNFTVFLQHFWSIEIHCLKNGNLEYYRKKSAYLQEKQGNHYLLHILISCNFTGKTIILSYNSVPPADSKFLFFTDFLCLMTNNEMWVTLISKYSSQSCNILVYVLLKIQHWGWLVDLKWIEPIIFWNQPIWIQHYSKAIKYFSVLISVIFKFFIFRCLVPYMQYSLKLLFDLIRFGFIYDWTSVGIYFPV